MARAVQFQNNFEFILSLVAIINIIYNCNFCEPTEG